MNLSSGHGRMLLCITVWGGGDVSPIQLLKVIRIIVVVVIVRFARAWEREG